VRRWQRHLRRAERTGALTFRERQRLSNHAESQIAERFARDRAREGRGAVVACEDTEQGPNAYWVAIWWPYDLEVECTAILEPEWGGWTDDYVQASVPVVRELAAAVDGLPRDREALIQLAAVATVQGS
jgi:hypothetical protein